MLKVHAAVELQLATCTCSIPTSGALRHNHCTETFIQHISCLLYTMTTILLEYLVFITLNWFMMSYFGHAQICCTDEENYVAGNIAKPWDFSIG